MAYTPTVWKNGEFPPIDAEHLNKIEQGIANSAPGGFGLGVAGGQPLSATDDLDTVTKNGVYQWSSSLPKNAPTGYCKMRVWNGADWISQEIMSAYANEKDSIRRRVFNNNVWGPFEWVNPPMALGVEYRTTERYLGKPVYVKAFNVPALPNNSDLSVNIATNSDGSADETIRAITGYGVTSNGSSIPSEAWSRDFSRKIYLQLYLWLVYFKTTFDASGESATIVVKYTKTTD